MTSSFEHVGWRQWRWDERVFPHAPVCPEHAEQDRVTRAERQSAEALSAASLETVGLMPIANGLRRMQELYARPFDAICHHRSCEERLAESIDVLWDDLDQPEV